MGFPRSDSHSERIRKRAREVLANLESLHEQQNGNQDIQAELDEHVALLRVECASLAHLERADQRERDLVSSQLETLNGDIDRARKDLQQKARYYRYAFTLPFCRRWLSAA